MDDSIIIVDLFQTSELNQVFFPLEKVNFLQKDLCTTQIPDFFFFFFLGWKQFYFDIIPYQMEGSHMLIAPAKQVTLGEN